MRTLVVGSGAVARSVTRALSDSGTEVALLDEAPASNYPGELVLGCGLWDPDEEADVARAVLKSRSSYVSASRDPDNVGALLSLDEEAKEQGSSVVCGMSWTPGLTNLMIMMGLTQVPAPRKVSVSWVVPPSAATLPWVAAALSGTAAVFSEGSWRRIEAGGSPEKVYLPEPVGWKTVRVARGAEAVTIPRHADVTEVIVRGGSGRRVADRLIERVSDDTELGPSSKSDHLSRLAGLAANLIAGRGDKAGWVAVRVDIEGTDGRVTLGVLEHASNLATAPLIAAAQLVGQGTPKPGTWTPEQILEPRDVFEAISKRGVRIARLIR